MLQDVFDFVVYELKIICLLRCSIFRDELFRLSKRLLKINCIVSFNHLYMIIPSALACERFKKPSHADDERMIIFHWLKISYLA